MSENEHAERLRFMSNANRRALQRLDNKLSAAFTKIQQKGEISASTLNGLLETAGRGAPENPQRPYVNVISKEGMKAKGLGDVFNLVETEIKIPEDVALPVLIHLQEQVGRALFAADNPDAVVSGHVGQTYGKEHGKGLFPYRLMKPAFSG